MNLLIAVFLSVGWREWSIFGLDALSSVLGVVGTYYMAKRYEPSFWSGLGMAFYAVYLRLRLKGKSVDNMYAAEANGNKTVPESPSQTAFGLNLLFLAFALQFIKILFAHYVLLYP